MGADGTAADGHPLLGRRLPPVALRTAEGPVTSARLLHPARGVLLDLADDSRLRSAARGWRDRVVTVTGGPEEDGPLTGLAALLVRPDGYVAWTGEDGDGGLTGALGRWFGPPAEGAGADVRTEDRRAPHHDQEDTA
ncbi:hypothetical protein [Streptomyces caatingaensis]